MAIKLIFWILAVYGMSTILVYGSIFSKPRTWIITHSKFFGELIQCMLCTSFWSGIFVSIALESLTAHLFDTIFPFNLLLDGCFSAGSVWALNSIIEWFEKNIPPNKNIL